MKIRPQPQKKPHEKKGEFSNLTSVEFALEGKSGSILEKFNGKESQITFLPYDIFQNKRILLLIQSCNNDGNELNKCAYNKELNLFNENILTRLGSFFKTTYHPYPIDQFIYNTIFLFSNLLIYC